MRDLRTVSIAVLVLLVACGTPRTEAPRSHPSPEPDELGRTREVQSGPLGDDRKVTLEEAEAETPYDLRIPPTNDETGELSGIFIDANPQVAFVWSTDMVFYVGRTDMSEAEAARSWKTKVTEQPEDGSEMTNARGHTAIGHDGHGDLRPSNLTWIEDGLSLQFVSPQHTLEQLRAFAEAVEVES